MHILVVDDEPYVREALRAVLRSDDTEIEAAGDAAGALEGLKHGACDLLITDIILPDMDGIELIHQVVRRWPHVRIIAMTGGGSTGLDGYRPDGIATCAYLEAARCAGAHGLLRKPFGLQQLRGMIREVLAVPQPAPA
jgi:CheY-like chemotaxis protein